jgi:hypothetical protein
MARPRLPGDWLLVSRGDGAGSAAGVARWVSPLQGGLRDHEKASIPGAQTERRGDAGPVRLLRGGETHRPTWLNLPEQRVVGSREFPWQR